MGGSGGGGGDYRGGGGGGGEPPKQDCGSLRFTTTLEQPIGVPEHRRGTVLELLRAQDDGRPVIAAVDDDGTVIGTVTDELPALLRCTGDGWAFVAEVITVNYGVHPDKVCTQKSITIGPSPGAKWRQDIQYGTEAWRREMGRRNEAEHFNADLKSAIQGALDSAGRRQVKGRTAATVFTAITIVAENVRRIDVFVAIQAKPKASKPRSKRRRDRPGSWGEESPLRRKQPGPAPPAAA